MLEMADKGVSPVIWDGKLGIAMLLDTVLV